ncbi:hypothetical protein H9L12_01005 [Sphingomonas rhizophila]|uniref:Uncharacterized protein n=1 Tax=Sphingomonas rhizophila TaxID=2071607 RepID=A0A7G9S8H7_9SPHN|nr:hypothetical protein [Sphingomonas rhizophila]QNN64152.1 hypothetical protein H9L12_07085 [Sphingomonas rhizophila]QNN65260.1 hypothetical protein H9L12_01005 [Sphingomonas rhizophila]
MNKAYDKLMREVCVGLGFCGTVIDGVPTKVEMYLPEQGPVRAEQFVDAVLRAEGWDPSSATAQGYRRSIRNAFVKHMGSDEVDAGSLRQGI